MSSQFLRSIIRKFPWEISCTTQQSQIGNEYFLYAHKYKVTEDYIFFFCELRLQVYKLVEEIDQQRSSTICQMRFELPAWKATVIWLPLSIICQPKCSPYQSSYIGIYQPYVVFSSDKYYHRFSIIIIKNYCKRGKMFFREWNKQRICNSARRFYIFSDF